MVEVTTRLHRRVLGPLWPAGSSDTAAVFSTVNISSATRQALTRHFTAPGIWRAGSLYGYVRNDALHVHIAAPNGYRLWADPVLDGNPAYELGWADALLALGPNPVDLVGSWIMRPDNRVPSYAEIEFWLRDGASKGIFDETSILLAVGLKDHHLETSAHVLADGVVITLEVNS